MVTLQTSSRKLSAVSLERFARAAQRAAGVKGAVEVLITGNRRMQSLNREFRGKNRPTDVLAFPAVQGTHGGDVAISAAMAAENAARLGHSLDDEIKVLMLHGMLHLAGYDHERDNGRMARREQQLRKKLKLPLTLTERAARQREKQRVRK